MKWLKCLQKYIFVKAYCREDRWWVPSSSDEESSAMEFYISTQHKQNIYIIKLIAKNSRFSIQVPNIGQPLDLWILYNHMRIHICYQESIYFLPQEITDDKNYILCV